MKKGLNIYRQKGISYFIGKEKGEKKKDPVIISSILKGLMQKIITLIADKTFTSSPLKDDVYPLSDSSKEDLKKNISNILANIGDKEELILKIQKNILNIEDKSYLEYLNKTAQALLFLSVIIKMIQGDFNLKINEKEISLKKKKILIAVLEKIITNSDLSILIIKFTQNLISHLENPHSDFWKNESYSGLSSNYLLESEEENCLYSKDKDEIVFYLEILDITPILKKIFIDFFKKGGININNISLKARLQFISFFLKVKDRNIIDNFFSWMDLFNEKDKKIFIESFVINAENEDFIMDLLEMIKSPYISFGVPIGDDTFSPKEKIIIPKIQNLLSILNKREEFMNKYLEDSQVEKCDISAYNKAVIKKLHNFIIAIKNAKDPKTVRNICEEMDVFKEELIIKEIVTLSYLKDIPLNERKNLDLTKINTLNIEFYSAENLPTDLKKQYQNILYKAFPFSKKKIDIFFNNTEVDICLLLIGKEVLSGVGIIPINNKKKLLNWFGVNFEKTLKGISVKSFFLEVINSIKNDFDLEINTRPWVVNSAEQAIKSGCISNNFVGKGFGFETDSYVNWVRKKEGYKNLISKDLTILDENEVKKIINKGDGFSKILSSNKKPFFGIKMNIKNLDYHSDKIDNFVYQELEKKYKKGFFLTNILYEKDFIYFLIEDQVADSKVSQIHVDE